MGEEAPRADGETSVRRLFPGVSGFLLDNRHGIPQEILLLYALKSISPFWYDDTITALELVLKGSNSVGNNGILDSFDEFIKEMTVESNGYYYLSSYPIKHVVDPKDQCKYFSCSKMPDLFSEWMSYLYRNGYHKYLSDVIGDNIEKGEELDVAILLTSSTILSKILYNRVKVGSICGHRYSLSTDDFQGVLQIIWCVQFFSDIYVKGTRKIVEKNMTEKHKSFYKISLLDEFKRSKIGNGLEELDLDLDFEETSSLFDQFGCYFRSLFSSIIVDLSNILNHILIKSENERNENEKRIVKCLLINFFDTDGNNEKRLTKKIGVNKGDLTVMEDYLESVEGIIDSIVTMVPYLCLDDACANNNSNEYFCGFFSIFTQIPYEAYTLVYRAYSFIYNCLSYSYSIKVSFIHDPSFDLEEVYFKFINSFILHFYSGLAEIFVDKFTLETQGALYKKETQEQIIKDKFNNGERIIFQSVHDSEISELKQMLIDFTCPSIVDNKSELNKYIKCYKMNYEVSKEREYGIIDGIFSRKLFDRYLLIIYKHLGSFNLEKSYTVINLREDEKLTIEDLKSNFIIILNNIARDIQRHVCQLLMDLYNDIVAINVRGIESAIKRLARQYMEPAKNIINISLVNEPIDNGECYDLIDIIDWKWTEETTKIIESKYKGKYLFTYCLSPTDSYTKNYYNRYQNLKTIINNISEILVNANEENVVETLEKLDKMSCQLSVPLIDKTFNKAFDYFIADEKGQEKVVLFKKPGEIVITQIPLDPIETKHISTVSGNNSNNNRVTETPTVVPKSPEDELFSSFMKLLIETCAGKNEVSPIDRIKIGNLKTPESLAKVTLTEETIKYINGAGPLKGRDLGELYESHRRARARPRRMKVRQFDLK